MNDPNALVKAAAAERRRIILAFLTIILLLGAVVTAGWSSAWNGREAWRDQAMTWQDRYVELYDEYTASTGQEPKAPEPSDVAKEAPEPEALSSEPGPVGPRGPRGESGRDSVTPGPAGEDGEDGDSVTNAQVAEAIIGYCADGRCVGPSGANGRDSTVPGPKGDTGAASTVPGPQGVGIAGIECLEDATWRFTMTDGTTLNVPGPCRIQAITEEGGR